MEKIMHIAAQYLATSAISFIAKKDDDSHTNLGWNNHTLETHEFPNGDRLGLNYESFSLEWTHQNGTKNSFNLNGTQHLEIIDWISKTSKNNGITKSYTYNLHYNLPYNEVTNSTDFKLTYQNNLNELIKNRDLAQSVISKLLKSNNYVSPIRIWPHHFDTGAFFNINEKLSIGLGMAIPDSVIDDFYFYISGYNNNSPIEIDVSNNIHKERYYNNSFQGFAMSVSELDENSAIDFCQAAINAYLNSMT